MRADWLVPLPEGLTLRRAMAIGTAGLTAMLAVMALEAHGLDPGARAGAGDRRGRRGRVGRGRGAGAAGLRGRRGHRPAGDRRTTCEALGAARIVPRADLAEPIARPLESESWAGGDRRGRRRHAVAGDQADEVPRRRWPRSATPAGVEVPLSIIPFLLRGISLLGIDSVLQPFAAPAGGLGAAGARPRPRPARRDDPARDARRGAGARRRHSQGRRCAVGWSSTSTPDRRTEARGGAGIRLRRRG